MPGCGEISRYMVPVNMEERARIDAVHKRPGSPRRLVKQAIVAGKNTSRRKGHLQDCHNLCNRGMCNLL
jgi:hypothetical protein